jgi:hypothetical protein
VPGAYVAPNPRRPTWQPFSACSTTTPAGGYPPTPARDGIPPTSDKDGPDSTFERALPEADVVISQPFWPAYLTAERMAKAPKLKLAVTVGIGSDHVDLDAAIAHGVTVAEVTYCKHQCLAWAELHQDELRENWERARAGETLMQIEPLR